MGTSKTELFNEEQNRLAKICKAMGHPARIAIVQYLLENDSCICKDFVSELPLSQPTISQHLSELKKAEVIEGKMKGNSICYCLNDKQVHVLLQMVKQMQSKIARAFFQTENI